MYIKTKGSNFTIQNKEEEKNLIDTINDKLKENRNNIYNCISVSTEQFTGKVKSVVLKMLDSNSIQVCSVDGSYPTMHLINPKTSTVVSTLTFETSEKQLNFTQEAVTVKDHVVEKVVEVVKEVVEPVVDVVETVVEDVVEPVEEVIEDVVEEVKAEAEAIAPKQPRVEQMTKRRPKNKKN